MTQANSPDSWYESIEDLEQTERNFELPTRAALWGVRLSRDYTIPRELRREFRSEALDYIALAIRNVLQPQRVYLETLNML